MNDLDFKIKYIKYKLKYLELKQNKQIGGMDSGDTNVLDREYLIDVRNQFHKILSEYDLDVQYRDTQYKQMPIPMISKPFKDFLKDYNDRFKAIESALLFLYDNVKDDNIRKLISEVIEKAEEALTLWPTFKERSSIDGTWGVPDIRHTLRNNKLEEEPFGTKELLELKENIESIEERMKVFVSSLQSQVESPSPSRSLSQSPEAKLHAEAKASPLSKKMLQAKFAEAEVMRVAKGKAYELKSEKAAADGSQSPVESADGNKTPADGNKSPAAKFHAEAKASPLSKKMLQAKLAEAEVMRVAEGKAYELKSEKAAADGSQSPVESADGNKTPADGSQPPVNNFTQALTNHKKRITKFNIAVKKTTDSLDIEYGTVKIQYGAMLEEILKVGTLSVHTEHTEQFKESIKYILNEFVTLFYNTYGHKTISDRNILELFWDIRHDKDMPSRAYKIKQGEFRNKNTNTLFNSLLSNYEILLQSNIIEGIKDSMKESLSDQERQKINNITEDDINKFSLYLGADGRIDFKTTFPFSAVSTLKQYKNQNFDIICTPITYPYYPDPQPVHDEATTNINLHFKDKGSSFGIYGDQAFESEIDGLQQLYNEPTDLRYIRNNNQIYNLLKFLGIDRFNFYSHIMTEYYKTMLNILNLDTKYVDFEFDKIEINENGRWYLYFEYKSLRYSIDITGRGSTDKSYNLKSIKIKIEDTDIDSFYIEHLGSILQNISSEYNNEFIENLYSIINLLAGLLAKSAGDDTQRTLLFCVSRLMEYFFQHRRDIKINISETTHDRQLWQRLLNNTLSNETYISNEHINISAVYKTNSKPLQKFLLGLASSYDFTDLMDNLTEPIKYFRFQIKTRHPNQVYNIDNIIRYYIALYFYIINISNYLDSDYITLLNTLLQETNNFININNIDSIDNTIIDDIYNGMIIKEPILVTIQILQVIFTIDDNIHKNNIIKLIKGEYLTVKDVINIQDTLKLFEIKVKLDDNVDPIAVIKYLLNNGFDLLKLFGVRNINDIHKYLGNDLTYRNLIISLIIQKTVFNKYLNILYNNTNKFKILVADRYDEVTLHAMMIQFYKEPYYTEYMTTASSRSLNESELFFINDILPNRRFDLIINNKLCESILSYIKSFLDIDDFNNDDPSMEQSFSIVNRYVTDDEPDDEHITYPTDEEIKSFYTNLKDSTFLKRLIDYFSNKKAANITKFYTSLMKATLLRDDYLNFLLIDFFQDTPPPSKKLERIIQEVKSMGGIGEDKKIFMMVSYIIAFNNIIDIKEIKSSYDSITESYQISLFDEKITQNECNYIYYSNFLYILRAVENFINRYYTDQITISRKHNEAQSKIYKEQLITTYITREMIEKFRVFVDNIHANVLEKLLGEIISLKDVFNKLTSIDERISTLKEYKGLTYEQKKMKSNIEQEIGKGNDENRETFDTWNNIETIYNENRDILNKEYSRMKYFLFIIENILNPSNLRKKILINKQHLRTVLDIEFANVTEFNNFEKFRYDGIIPELEELDEDTQGTDIETPQRELEKLTLELEELETINLKLKEPDEDIQGEIKQSLESELETLKIDKESIESIIDQKKVEIDQKVALINKIKAFIETIDYIEYSYSYNEKLNNRLVTILFLLYIYIKYNQTPFKSKEILDRLLLNNYIFKEILGIEILNEVFDSKYIDIDYIKKILTDEAPDEAPNDTISNLEKYFYIFIIYIICNGEDKYNNIIYELITYLDKNFIHDIDSIIIDLLDSKGLTLDEIFK